ncbi:MAG: hypothetical protein JSC189_001171 [Candidatus Tokpelaia sp. JSC189]|nr:MAG: hypothetical protein JSC189_001171 [Candidatus Tokpelaia sp. JSC189]
MSGLKGLNIFWRDRIFHLFSPKCWEEKVEALF